MFTNRNLNSFLYLGYFLDYQENNTFPLVGVNTQQYAKATVNDLVEIGSKILLDSFAEVFISNSKHLVPLSGGLDSRGILGALLEFTSSNNINSFTYGVPGTMDYELGKYVSKIYGINNLCINFYDMQFTFEMLIDAAKRFRRQTILFFHPDHLLLEQIYGDHYYWSGFYGDVAAGDFLHPGIKDGKGIDYLKKKFLNNNRYVKSKYLPNKPIDDLFTLLDGLDHSIENLNDYEKLDIFNRQVKYTAPHKCPEGFRMVIPYISSKWLSFITSVPRKYRNKGLLYQRILLYTFPDLFNLPTRNKYGLSLNSTNLELMIKRIENKLFYYLGGRKSAILKSTNYFNINDFIRTNSSLKLIIIDSLRKLKSRDIVPWIDIDSLLNDHLKNKENYGDVLQTLASLEIIMSSFEK